MMKAIQGRQSLIKDKKGTTMIEVLMAMTIFTVGFLATGTMVISTTRNTTTGNMVTQATMAAREKIEFLITLPIDEMNAWCPDAGELEIIDSIYELKCDVTSISSSANIIVVTVSWNRRGKNRELVLKTLTRGNGT